MNYKLAISSTGKNLDDMVDRFGRCQYFIISEIENDVIKSYQSLPNKSLNQAGGAGISAAQDILMENPKAVIATNLGVNALNVIEQANIEAYSATGTVENAILAYISKNLSKISGGQGGSGTGMGSGIGRGIGGGGRGMGGGRGGGMGGGRRQP